MAAVAELEDDLLAAAQRLDDATRAWRRAGPEDLAERWCAMVRSLLQYLAIRDGMDPTGLRATHPFLDDDD